MKKLALLAVLLLLALPAMAQTVVTGGVNDKRFLEPTFIWMREEFVSSLSTNGNIGDLGWFINTIGSAPLVGNVTVALPHVGILKLSTAVAATAGQGGSLTLAMVGSGAGLPLPPLSTQTGWQSQFIFSLNQTTDTRFRVGLINAATSVVQPTDGLWLRYDTEAAFADTTFWFAFRSSSSTETVTDVNTGVAVDTLYHRVRFSSTVAGTVLCQLYNAAGALQASVSLSTGMPTTNLSPAFIVATNATAQKSAEFDYFHFSMPVVR